MVKIFFSFLALLVILFSTAEKFKQFLFCGKAYANFKLF